MKDSDGNENSCATADFTGIDSEFKFGSVSCSGAVGSTLVLTFNNANTYSTTAFNLCMVAIFGSDRTDIEPYVVTSSPAPISVTHDLLSASTTTVTAPTSSAPILPSDTFKDISWAFQNGDGQAYNTDIFDTVSGSNDMTIKSFADASTTSVGFRLALIGDQSHKFVGSITEPTSMSVDSVAVTITYLDACQDGSA